MLSAFIRRERGKMTLQGEFTTALRDGDTSGKFEVTIVLREFDEENEHYFVAECLEIPGCISQGDTEEEARKNIEEALELCLSVMFEDCVKQVVARHRVPDLTNIKSQRSLTVTTVRPELEYA